MKKLFSLFFLGFILFISFLYLAPKSSKAFAACVAGTGSTNASCGGPCSGYQCNGSTCQTQGYYCSAGNCVCGWSAGTVASNACQCGGNGCGTCSGATTGCLLNGSTCQTQGKYCSAGSCVSGWAGGSACSPSSCTSSTPTPTPASGSTCTCYSGCGTCSTVTVTGSCASNGYNTFCPACPPPVCTPTTSCAAQGATCGSIYNGCNTVSCGTCSGGSVCQGNTCVLLNSIDGNVFVDQNKDGVKNGADENYTGSITISPNPTGATVTYPNPKGYYLISGLTAGTYTISYTSLPTGYQMTNPKNGPPPSFSVTVGAGCSVGGSNSAACDANGNITNLNYGITNSVPWIQTTGGDPYFGSGISNPIPDNTPSCGAYMSLRGAGGSPGVVYTGNGSVNLGFGQASQNPDNWLAANLYTPKSTELKTSYNTMYQTAIRSGITPTPLGSSQCGAGGINNCALTGDLANGVYAANDDLNINSMSQSNTFSGNRDIVILVDGDLNINTEVHVPVGSTALFTASGNINVDASVGNTDTTSQAANIEGYYSTDKSFYVKSLDPTGKGLNCPTSDKRLNVAGAIVVNASLTGGSFVNQRDLCSGNLECPAFTVIERPDFILNSPEFIKSARRIWQEIAP